MNTRCLLAGLGLLLLPSIAHAQDCMNLVDAVDSIAAALAEVEIDRAQEVADQAIHQLECQEQPVNTVMLTGLFQLAGAVAAFNGETTDAEQAFARAVAISPTTPIDAVYGGDVEQLYQQVQRRLLDESGGSLLLSGSARAWLDGRQVTMGQPVDVVVGHHLLQWQEDDGPMQAREIRVAAMETRQLTLGVVDPDAQRRQRSVAPPSSGRGSAGTALLIGGGAGVVVGGVLLGLASGAQSAFFREEDPTALAGIQARNHALALSGISLLAAGAGTAGVSFFVQDAPGVRVGFTF
mgnify:CR=1 FL=1